MRGWRSAEISDELRALLRFAEALTREPGAVTGAQVEALRTAGWGDEAILHACEVVSYFNFVNRLADGLGVRLEEGWPHPLIGEPDHLHGHLRQGEDMDEEEGETA